MSLTEQCLRTISKLDEISMFMTDFKDIREEHIKEFGFKEYSKEFQNASFKKNGNNSGISTTNGFGPGMINGFGTGNNGSMSVTTQLQGGASFVSGEKE